MVPWKAPWKVPWKAPWKAPWGASWEAPWEASLGFIWGTPSRPDYRKRTLSAVEVSLKEGPCQEGWRVVGRKESANQGWP